MGCAPIDCVNAAREAFQETSGKWFGQSLPNIRRAGPNTASAWRTAGRNAAEVMPLSLQ